MRPGPSDIHGSVTSHLEINNFVFTETVYKPQSSITTHFHRHACIYAVLQGTSTETFGRTKIESKPHSLIFLPAGEPHSDQVGSATTRFFVIEVEDRWLKRFRECAQLLNNPMIFQGCSLMHNAMKLRQESCHPDCITPLAVEALVIEIITEACRRQMSVSRSKAPHWLQQTKEMLHESFLEPLSLSRIAETVGVHTLSIWLQRSGAIINVASENTDDS